LSIREKFDVVIIGGGPAAMSAAIWCADLGMSSVVLEREKELYGQLRWIHRAIKNYLGVAANNGTKLIELFERSAAAWGIDAETNVSIEAIDCKTGMVRLADGRALTGRVLFIATGVRRRALEIPGELEFQGKGILRSGAGERESVKGERVVVVGGGDAAAENALLLSERADKVLLIHRKNALTARTEFQEKVAATPNIELILDTEIAEIGGTDHVEWVETTPSRGGSRKRLLTDHFIARIGVTPNSELFTSQLATDERGYIITDNLCRTSVEYVYAIGDVANPISPTIATAIGTGTAAAKAASSLLTSLKPV